MNEKNVLEWAEFVATKFGYDESGWKVQYRNPELVHIRYKRDFTGYDHWTKRLGRFLREINPVEYFRKSDHWTGTNRNLSGYLMNFPISYQVYLQKDRNTPDATVNGNIFHWSEDAEYVTFFQPRVGVKVLEFIKKNPDDPWAQSILEAMVTCANESFDKEESE